MTILKWNLMKKSFQDFTEATDRVTYIWLK